MREPAIPPALASVHQQAEEYRKLLEELSRRLAPVVSQTLPCVGELANKHEASCELADRLATISGILGEGNAIMGSLLRRLEV